MYDEPQLKMTDNLEVVVRRSPRYPMFLLLGVVLGFVVAGVLALLPVDTSVLTSDYSTVAAMGLLMIVLGLFGLALGGFVAILLDRANSRKARTYTVRGEFVARQQKAPEHTTNGTGSESRLNPEAAVGDAEPTGTADVDSNPDDSVKQ